MALIACKNLSLGYDGHKILENLNFEVCCGDYLCIIGENGSGKTTLIKTLLNIIKPLSGEINIGEGFARNRIGYLPQQTLIQKDFPASVFEVVISGVQSKKGIRPFYNKSEKELAKRNIEKMHLSDLSNRCYRELSGGQQQRVLLARALCATENIILLDEPVSGLDPVVTEEMYKTISELNKNDKITVIMISHDIKSVLKYATHVMHISDKIFFGTKEEYLLSDFGKKFTEVNQDGNI